MPKRIPKHEQIKIGDVFNDLTVIGEPEKTGQKWKFLCRCKCGVEKEIRVDKLGIIRSCGCYIKKVTSERSRKYECGHDHPIYRAWLHLKKVCLDKKYHRYNGKQIYEPWLDFNVFYEWAKDKWQEGLCLSLIESEGNYTPDNLHFVTQTELRKKKGTERNNAKYKQIKIGDKYNFLTVIEEVQKTNIPNKKWYKYTVKCLCDCGQTTIVNISALINERTKSCGCYNRLAASERMVKYNTKYSKNITKHPLYKSWQCMKNMCFNSNSPVYNGKSIHLAWIDNYEAFYDWAKPLWKPYHRLRLIDQEKNYTPDNLTFVHARDIVRENANSETAKQKIKEYWSNITKEQLQIRTEKRIQSQLEKYGVAFPQQLESIKQKIRETCLQRYGTTTSSQNKEVKDKAKKTNLEKYGYEYTFSCPDIQQKSKQTCIEKYGTPYYSVIKGKEEQDVRDFIESFGSKFPSDYNILDGKEIDMFNSELRLGIEYHGIFWHCSKFQPDKNYHYKKYKKCLEQNIRLISIFSDEWLSRKKQVKNFLKSILNTNPIRIYARKCSIKEVDKKTGRQFIEDNHIQGESIRSNLFVGLYHKDDLVGIMSFATHHRNSIEYTLDRMCFKDDVQVVGGASKMLKFALPIIKSKGYDKIISWSDNRWSQGNVYLKMGFVLDKELKPDYSYVNVAKSKNNRISKQSMTKKKLNCPPEKTEKEWAKELGFEQIWDCGKKRWIYYIS